MAANPVPSDVQLSRSSIKAIKILTLISVTSLVIIYSLSLNYSNGISDGQTPSPSSTQVQNTSRSESSARSVQPPIDVSNRKQVISQAEITASFPRLCDVHQLHRVSITKQSNGNDSFTLKEISQTAKCPRKLKMIDFPYIRTWFMSFPGSGNTWVRHLLQELTGFPTGSIYNDLRLQENGFPCESQTEDVIAIKTHSFNTYSRKQIYINRQTDRMLILIRNPFSAMFADYKRGKLKLQHSGNALVDTTQDLWHDFVNIKSPKWRKLYRDALLMSMDKMVIFYEDLVSDLLPQLVQMANFLSSDYLSEFSFCCVMHNDEGLHHRAPSEQTEDDVFNYHQRLNMNFIIEELAEEIQNVHPRISARILTYRMKLNS